MDMDNIAIKSIVSQILNGIASEEKEERRSPLRMSSSGKCARAIAYQYHKFEASELSPRAMMVFRLGHTIEAEVKALIAKYCDLPITYPTETIKYTVDGVDIDGHVDGLIGDDMVLEVKSINGMRFKNLDREGIPEDYRKQACSYMKALNRTKTLFVFYCKDTSHLREMIFEYDPLMFEEIYSRFSSVIQSTKENLPAREYGPLKSGFLGWRCSYCSFWKHCYEGAVLTFDKNNKPQIKVKDENL